MGGSQGHSVQRQGPSMQPMDGGEGTPGGPAAGIKRPTSNQVAMAAEGGWGASRPMRTLAAAEQQKQGKGMATWEGSRPPAHPSPVCTCAAPLRPPAHHVHTPHLPGSGQLPGSAGLAGVQPGKGLQQGGVHIRLGGGSSLPAAARGVCPGPRLAAARKRAAVKRAGGGAGRGVSG